MASYRWTQEFPGSITVCDRVRIILEKNDSSAKTFAEQGGKDLIGSNMLDCHPELDGRSSKASWRHSKPTCIPSRRTVCGN